MIASADGRFPAKGVSAPLRNSELDEADEKWLTYLASPAPKPSGNFAKKTAFTPDKGQTPF